MSAHVIALTAADRDRWAELWTGYLTFYQTVLPPAIYTSTWSRILDPQGDIRAFGVRDDVGRLVGITHYFFHPHAWSTLEACYLQDLFVDADARGQGYARALIEAVAAVAQARPCRSLYWQTHETNATARRLYDAIGKTKGFIVYDYRLTPAARDAATSG